MSSGEFPIPLIPEIGVIALVPDRWTDLWQPRHQILSRLGRYFHVVWEDPAHKWREALRNPTRLDSPPAEPERTPGLAVYVPEFWLPTVYRPKILADLAFAMRLKRANRILIQRGVQKRILYLWRPDFEKALDILPFDLTCYHMDDEYSFSPIDLPLNEKEARLISRVNQVFVHSPALMEKKGCLNPNTTMIPNGVDFQAYSRKAEEPPDLAGVPHPRIGYTGWLKKHLDWPLLQYLTEHHPDWSFVFVGPQSPHPEVTALLREFSQRPNVYLLGARSNKDIAAYPQHFDVCIMPYCVNDYTKFIYPLKLHEYLASGRPTVGAGIRSLEEFADVISLPCSPGEWSAQLERALKNDTPRDAEARRSVARRYDWDILVEQIAACLCQRLGRDSRKLFHFREQFEKEILPRS